MKLPMKIGLSAGLLFMLFGCGSKDPAQQGSPKTSPAKLVKVQPVTTRTLVEKLELPGTIQPENVANVLSTAEGRITQLLAREGDPVAADMVLAMLSPLVREDIITSARLLVQNSKEALEKNSGDPKLRQKLEQAEADYRFALQQYKEIPVTAPISGVISQRWVDLGDMVPAKARMFEVQGDDRLRIDVPVSELDIGRLRAGQTASIRADACPEKTFHGRIQRVHPQVDPATRHALVEVHLHDPSPDLRAGMFVRLTFITRTLDNAPAVPATAIIERPRDRIVFTVNGEKAQEIILETGMEADGWVEVHSGIEPGDVVVIEGQEQLISGAPVKIHGQAKENLQQERTGE